MPQFLWTSDPSGKLKLFNQSSFDLIGLTFDQILEKELDRIVHPDDR
jgi:PAS domain-containing protein